MAYSGSMFINNFVRGLNGEPMIYDYAFVSTPKEPCPFFTTRCQFGV